MIRLDSLYSIGSRRLSDRSGPVTTRMLLQRGPSNTRNSGLGRHVRINVTKTQVITEGVDRLIIIWSMVHGAQHYDT